MKTPDNVLSFEDININAALCIDLEAGKNVVPVTSNQVVRRCKIMVEMFTHTFLEWELYDNYIYRAGWKIEYVIESLNHHQIATASIATRVDTLPEAKIIAEKKVSRYLGAPIFLVEQTETVKHIYNIIDRFGIQHGTVIIKKII